MTASKRERDNEILRAINRCWLSIKQVGRKLLAQPNYNVTFEQLMVLFILEERDGQNIRFLAELTDKERTTMTRMVDGLERRNLVVRVPDKSDGRNKLVYLTHQGRKLTQEVDMIKTDFDSVIFKGLTKSEIGKAVVILNKMSDNLNTLE